jgi:ATP/maltotriose-dependent transcriptional regulator MalT
MFSAQVWEQIARSLGLSGRELQVVRGVFDDRIESAIATELGISPHTVHTHFDRLHRKLGVATRTGLVLRVTREFLALSASSSDPVQLAAFAQPSTAPTS